MIPKKLDDITADDIRALIADGMRESRTIEYKLTLPSESDKDRKEFLADVSSFANAEGGYLIYGVAANKGVPTEVIGLDGFDPDQGKLRLEQMLRTSVEPPIAGIRVQAVEGFSKGPVFIIQAPRSWSRPHMVKYKGSSRFFGRGSAGKFPMDYRDIRAAFAMAEDLPERIRRWRDERIKCILADETPVRLLEGARLAVHVVPMDSFGLSPPVSASELDRYRNALNPLYESGDWWRINLDGLLIAAVIHSSQDRLSYCQIYRSGRIESVYADLIREYHGRKAIEDFHEAEILQTVTRYLNVYTQLGISAPYVAMVTLLNAQGMKVIKRDALQSLLGPAIDRPVVVLPELLIPEWPCDLPRAFQPVFDALWNASGQSRSLNYDADSNWIGYKLDGVPTDSAGGTGS